MAIDPRTADALLDALVDELAHRRAVDVERAAHGRKSMADVKQDEDAVARDARAQARRERDDFRHALADAWGRARESGDELVYDSGKAAEDRAAELLIRYLVQLGYADLSTEERGPGQTLYRLRVFWDRLRALAERSGHSLPV